jgi:sulfonate transport system substrate-binding protein
LPSNKGSNVHYLLVKALEEAGLAYEDVTPAFLPPADARAAFERGAVDAWVIWDPFQAAAEIAIEARELRNGEGIVSNHQYYLGSRDFVDAHPEASRHPHRGHRRDRRMDKATLPPPPRSCAPEVGIPADVLTLALERQTYGVKPLDPRRSPSSSRRPDTTSSSSS